MLVRLVHFLIGLALGAGGGYLVWMQRAAASAPLFPPGPEGMPWLLIAGLAAAIAGLVFIVTAVLPRPKRAAQRAAAAAWRESKLSQADDYYAKTKDAPQDRDWRSGLLPPEPTPRSAAEPEPEAAEPSPVPELFRSDPPKAEPRKPDPLLAPLKAEPRPDFSMASSRDPLLKPLATNEDLFEPVIEVAPAAKPQPEPQPPAAQLTPAQEPETPALQLAPAPEPEWQIVAPEVVVPEIVPEVVAEPEPAKAAEPAPIVVPTPARPLFGKPTATGIPPEGAATPFPSAATLTPIPKSSDPPPPPATDTKPAAPVTFDAIRAAIADGRLDEADRMLTAEKDRAQGEALAELTGLAGDHAAAAGRQSNAKWLWRLALKRFGECNAMNSPAARAVSERLRLSDT